MARDQHAVLRHHQVRLDVVRTLLDRQAIALQRVLSRLLLRQAAGSVEEADLVAVNALLQ